MKLKIGQIKVASARAAVKKNSALLMAVLSEMASHRPDVVVTPECFLDGYAAADKKGSKKDVRRYAIDPAASRHTARVSDWSRANSCWTILGCTRKESGDIFNTACVFDRGGTLVGCYDKAHCQLHDRKFSPGRALPVFDSDFGLFGVMICADRRWPETVRTLALKGARIIFNPTWGMACDLNLAMMRTRSFESEIFIAFTHPLQSLVTAPDGAVVADNRDAGMRFTITEVELSDVDNIRKSGYTHLRDRRADIYELGDF